MYVNIWNINTWLLLLVVTHIFYVSFIRSWKVPFKWRQESWGLIMSSSLLWWNDSKCPCTLKQMYSGFNWKVHLVTCCINEGEVSERNKDGNKPTERDWEQVKALIISLSINLPKLLKLWDLSSENLLFLSVSTSCMAYTRLSAPPPPWALAASHVAHQTYL